VPFGKTQQFYYARKMSRRRSTLSQAGSQFIEVWHLCITVALAQA
jgi:hypothetical protein